MDETVNQLLSASKEVGAPARSARSTNTKRVAFLSVGLGCVQAPEEIPVFKRGVPRVTVACVCGNCEGTMNSSKLRWNC
jgi:hypothetical protein